MKNKGDKLLNQWIKWIFASSPRHDLISICLGEDDDDDFVGSEEIVTRTQFPESWLWEDIELPDCQRNIPW